MLGERDFDVTEEELVVEHLRKLERAGYIPENLWDVVPEGKMVEFPDFMSKMPKIQKV